MKTLVFILVFLSHSFNNLRGQLKAMCRFRPSLQFFRSIFHYSGTIEMLGGLFRKTSRSSSCSIHTASIVYVKSLYRPPRAQYVSQPNHHHLCFGSGTWCVCECVELVLEKNAGGASTMSMVMHTRHGGKRKLMS